MSKLHYIYELPFEDNRVGCTSRFQDRMRNHKREGRNISGVRILKAFLSRPEALAYERMLQEEQGYSGHNYGPERNAKVAMAKVGNNFGSFQTKESREVKRKRMIENNINPYANRR